MHFTPIPLQRSHKGYASSNGLCMVEPQSCKQHHSHSDVDMVACVNDAHHLTYNTNIEYWSELCYSMLARISAIFEKEGTLKSRSHVP